MYVGEDKYFKVIIDTHTIKNGDFIITPHHYWPHSQEFPGKDEIMHYHCWVNSRYKYKEDMKKIDFLKNN